MPNIGAPELIMILLVALIVFGPRKLPVRRDRDFQAVRPLSLIHI